MARPRTHDLDALLDAAEHLLATGGSSAVTVRALAGATGLEERLRRLAAERSREGYMAEVQPDGRGWLLLEHHCPVCAAAAACEGFCRSELALFREALGPAARVERTAHLLDGDARCVYRVAPAADEVAPAPTRP